MTTINIRFLQDYDEGENFKFKKGQTLKIKKEGGEHLIKRGVAEYTTTATAKKMEQFCKQEAKKHKLPPIKETLEREERPKIESAILENVYKTTEKYIYVNDRNRIDVILATAMSNQLSGTPIWMFIVGNSGDWKSAFTCSLEGLDHIIKLDMITKNTLASGSKGNDLGYFLQNSSHILLFPDLASLMSSHTDEKNAIWGQMRNLYDGFINKRTGNDVHRKYENCHVTLIACTTQVIRDEILIHAQLGTRELMYDTATDTVDNNFKMDAAWKNEDIEQQMKDEISEAVHNFLTYRKIKNIAIPEEIKSFIKQQANRLSILRAGGKTDRRYKELLNPVYPEVPTRVVKQFKRLYIALKSLDDNYPDEKVKEIISHIVNSSGNKVRQLILEFFEKNPDVDYKISEIQHHVKLSRDAVKVQLETLWNLSIIDKEVREERIGGYVHTDSYTQQEEIRGGRIEEVAYYRYRSKAVMTYLPPQGEK